MNQDVVERGVIVGGNYSKQVSKIKLGKMIGESLVEPKIVLCEGKNPESGA